MRNRLSWRCSLSWLESRRLQLWRARRVCGHPLKLPASRQRIAPPPPRLPPPRPPPSRTLWCRGWHSPGPRSRSSEQPQRLLRRPPRGPRPLRPQPRRPPVTPPRPPLARRWHLKQGCRSWSVTWARPRRTWQGRAANSPRLPTKSRWSPRRWRSFTRPMPSCCRILMVSCMVPPLYSFHRLLHIRS
jgi:hypothetical protein